MPLVQDARFLTPYIVHDAPVNQKTKELREKFDMDEETGYPRCYNWRPLARLGPDYRPEDPYKKFDKFNPDEYYTTKILLTATSAGFAIIFQMANSWIKGKPYHHSIYRPIIGFGICTYASHWLLEKSLERQAKKNGFVVDYLLKHPERFDTIHRPKVREVLFYYYAPR